MDMKNLIKEVVKEEDMLSKISFSIGWLKGESEKKGNEKQFSSSEVLELLKSIRDSYEIRKMKKIELYLDDDFKDIFTEWDEVEVYRTLSVADDVDLWDRAINLDGKFYSVCTSQGNKYKIRELEQFDIEEEENWDTSEIKCPICGYEESDSWEYDSDYGEIKCGGCGATLEWSREVEVSYSTEVKKVMEPLSL